MFDYNVRETLQQIYEILESWGKCVKLTLYCLLHVLSQSWDIN